MRAILLLAFLASALVRGTAAEPKNAAGFKSPLSPAEAIKQLRIAPGLRIELVASEPDIESPVAAAFDEDGRLWVVEMRDYPNGPAKGALQRNRVWWEKKGRIGPAKGHLPIFRPISAIKWDTPSIALQSRVPALPAVCAIHP